jgi:hypothetical protein
MTIGVPTRRGGGGIQTGAMASHPGEVITLQFGNYANFVGSHFWNFQVRPPPPNSPTPGAPSRTSPGLPRCINRALGHGAFVHGWLWGASGGVSPIADARLRDEALDADDTAV